MKISRRAFVRAGAAASIGLGARALLAPTVGRADARDKALVVIFLRGAVDGLSVAIPYADADYRAGRPTIALPAPNADAAALDLGGGFALHPKMAALAPRFRDGTLGILHAVGSPDPTRSHFDAQDFMESGTPGVRSTPDGWLNRCLRDQALASNSPFAAVSLGDALPRALWGPAPALSARDLTRVVLPSNRPAGRAIERALRGMYGGEHQGVVESSGAAALELVDAVRALDPGAYQPAAGATYEGPLGQKLSQLALLLKANVGLRVGCIDVGGWDTHQNQGDVDGPLGRRLGRLADALAAFATDLGPRLDDVVVLTVTEFGRTVRENGTRGTDHGHGAAMLALGGKVAGGRVIADWPGLSRDACFEGRDLAVTTDFRDVFAELAARHLGVNTDALFPAFETDANRYVGVLR